MYYQIEITTHCSFGCFYCAGREMKQEHMTWEVFEAILGRIPIGEHIVSLQGEGEPTLHPRFWDMAEAVVARGLQPATITNGYEVDTERLARFFPTLGISIDTLDPDEATRIGRYKLPKVLATLDHLLERMGPQRVRVHTTDYGQDIAPVVALAKRKGIAQHNIQALQTKDDYARRYADRMAPAMASELHFGCAFIRRPKMTFFDVAGREMPCCYIKDGARFESVSAIRQALARGEVPDSCAGCREIIRPETSPALPLFSIITTCKGRLDHLRQTLPTMLAQPWAEVIVVDYDCPQGTADWVAENHPLVRVVRVRDKPLFNVADARNRGAALAQGDWLAFVDADILLCGEFLAPLAPFLKPMTRWGSDGFDRNTIGTHLVARDDFFRVGGYDEVLRGWGSEDEDLYRRLDQAGCRLASFNRDLLHPLEHDNGLRTAFHELEHLWLNQRINAFYLQIKQDLQRLLAQPLPVDQRELVYGEIRRSCIEAAKVRSPTVRFDLSLPGALDFRIVELGWSQQRKLTYEFAWKQPG